MGLHKLTAGDGYTYLTRQVAAHDATERGHASLGDYYSERGESPGRWWGSGLAGVDLAAGRPVTEAQMRALFGEGRHPDAEAVRTALLTAGASAETADKATRLGGVFRVYEGAPELQREVARRLTQHIVEAGRHWKAPIARETRAEIRTQVAHELFVREHGRAPLDDRELAGFIARESRQRTTAVAGFDLTFSPVKSVSGLWAVADPGVAHQIEAAHDAAVEDTLGWLQQEATFTRRGANGVRQVPTRGLIGARFNHRDARSGDPDLHTHVAVSNKVQALDGTWLALDGRILYQANVAASERYNTRLEGELGNRLGITFSPRGDAAPGKREVREVDGLDPRLLSAWARRRVAIDARRRELTTGFQATHGRPPTPAEAIALAQQATLETRQAKHAPRSEAEQRRAWAAEAAAVLGGDAAVERMVAESLHRGTTHTRPTASVVNQQARRVIEAVQADRATWQVWHLRAEAERQVRASGIPAKWLDEAVDRVVHRAVTHHSVPFADPDPVGEPDALRHPDGSSVYRQHGATRYTSAAILDAERRLVAAAAQTGGRRVTDVRVGIALAEHTANGIRLHAAQAALVRELATSGRRLQLALAPAGTGKTTTMEVLARAWRDSGGTVVGLAPSAVAAHQLRAAIDAPTDTLSKLTWSLDHPDPPPWVTAIDATTLVLVDEAGMAGTLELARAVEHLTRHGATVRLIGDDRQLASVAAGGVLRDILTTVGAVTLSEVHRFHDPAEAAATLALRTGDPAALGFYADRGRVHVGDLAGAADQAYLAWRRDRAAGRDSILLAPTQQLVAELNTRARTDRLTHAPHQDAAPSRQHRAPVASDPQGHRPRVGHPPRFSQDRGHPGLGGSRLRDGVPAAGPLLCRHHQGLLHRKATPRRRRPPRPPVLRRRASQQHPADEERNGHANAHSAQRCPGKTGPEGTVRRRFR
jgi:conjugative relaxase-like TrwC/TraI family protein